MAALINRVKGAIRMGGKNIFWGNRHARQTIGRERNRIVRCSAGALVRDGMVLLVKRSPWALFYPNVWDLFGGHIESEETSEEALRREAVEELGVYIESFHPLGSICDPVEKAEIMVYAITEWRGEPTNVALDEHTEIRWFGADSLPESAALAGYGDFIFAAIAMSLDDHLHQEKNS